MLHREITLPVPAERLWEALTDPDLASAWLGSRVEWDLVAGGRARFTGGPDPDRAGRVEEVGAPGQLRFRWWEEGDESAVTEVSYALRPEGAGTHLTITEEWIGAEPDTGGDQPGPGVSGTRPGPPTAVPAPLEATAADVSVAGRWTATDDRLWGMWCQAAARPVAVAR